MVPMVNFAKQVGGHVLHQLLYLNGLPVLHIEHFIVNGHCKKHIRTMPFKTRVLIP